LWEIFRPLIFVGVLVLVSYFLFLFIQMIIPLDWLINLVQRIFENLAIDIKNQVDILLDIGIQTGIFLILFILSLIFFRIITKQDLVMLQNAKLKIPFKKVLIKILRNKRQNGFCIPV
jgi:hypothetical protein